MKRPPVLHPFLLSGYPILFLFAHNADLSVAGEVIRPAIAVLAVASLGWFLLRQLPFDRLKLGLLLSVFLLFFFSYGRVGELFPEFAITVGDFSLGQSKAWFLLWLLLLVLISAAVARIRRDLTVATRVLNVMSLVLLVLPAGSVLLRSPPAVGSPWNYSQLEAVSESVDAHSNPGRLPNIYYIILDGYARRDTLRELYGYDNSGFENELVNRGFYVAERSVSNYAQTIMSLASSLNLLHLQEIGSAVGSGSVDREPLIRAIRENNAIGILSEYDYQYVAFTSGYSGVDIKNADVVMRAPYSLSEYEATLLTTTPLLDVMYELGLYDPWEMHRKRLSFIFDTLPEVGLSSRPAFVLVHIISPHPPFVFGENGEKIEQREINPGRYFTFRDGIIKRWGLDVDEYRSSYVAQLRFINSRILDTVDRIFAANDVPPVIIIQGDHGPRSLLDLDTDSIQPNPGPQSVRERMRILNAYHIPKGGNSLLHPGVTPVNSFRIVFRHLLGMNFGLLPDRSYYTRPYKTYEFVDVTEIVGGSE